MYPREKGSAQPPLSRMRSPSTRSSGHLEKLARVRFFDLAVVAERLAEQHGGYFADLNAQMATSDPL